MEKLAMFFGIAASIISILNFIQSQYTKKELKEFKIKFENNTNMIKGNNSGNQGSFNNNTNSNNTKINKRGK